MANEKLVWDAEGSRLYETGVSNGVLYVADENGTYPNGVVWNGLINVNETPSGAEANPIYADDIKYLNLISVEEFGATVEAYSSPEEFDACDGSVELVPGLSAGQQKRQKFGLAYKTLIGNDVSGTEYGKKLHLIYGCTAAPSERAYATVNDSPEAITLSWEISTVPVALPDNLKPTSRLTIDSTKFTSTEAAKKLAKLEAILFGCDNTFSTTSTYAVGDLVKYTTGEGTSAVTELYECTTAISEAGEWDSTKFTKIGLAGPRLPLPAEIKTILT